MRKLLIRLLGGYVEPPCTSFVGYANCFITREGDTRLGGGSLKMDRNKIKKPTQCGSIFTGLVKVYIEKVE